MARTYNLIRKYYPQDKRLFVDANIFIFVFFAALKPQNDYSLRYAEDYEDLLEHGFQFYSNYYVISEVINVVISDAQEHFRVAYPFKYRSFKQYRNSPEGQRKLDEIIDIVQNNILDHIDIMDKPFSLQDIRNMVVNDGLDCTDKAIYVICKAYNVTLFTDDQDFRHTVLDILTRNKTILNEIR